MNRTRNVDLYIGFLKGDTNLTKEGSFTTTLCSNSKHSLNLTCHTHKRNATEVTKTRLISSVLMQNRKEIDHHYSQNQHYPGFLRNLALVILQYA